MLVQKVKEICNVKGLTYKGGDDFWLNLSDYPEDADLPFEERQKYVFLRPANEKGNINGYGAIESFDIDFNIVLAVRSKLSDESFDYKFDTHIKKLKPIARDFIESFSSCDGFLLKAFSMSIVTDVYDTNMDGYLIKILMEEQDE